MFPCFKVPMESLSRSDFYVQTKNDNCNNHGCKSNGPFLLGVNHGGSAMTSTSPTMKWFLYPWSKKPSHMEFFVFCRVM